MKELSKTIRRGLFDYEQEFRRGRVAIYRQVDRRTGSIRWEVIRIGSYKAATTSWGSVEASECYPSSESWGKYGFTFLTRAEADAKAAQL